MSDVPIGVLLSGLDSSLTSAIAAIIGEQGKNYIHFLSV
jgi:asparagine synthetase B (glutamine-hydrolysing)